MPKLPDERDLGARPRVGAARGAGSFSRAAAGASRAASIVSADAERTGSRLVELGQGLEYAGETVRRVEVRREKAKADYEMMKAKARRAAALIELENSFEGDPDYPTYGDRFDAAAADTIEEIAQNLQGRQREVFKLEGMAAMARARGRIQDKARAAERDHERANIKRTLETNEQSALQAQDPAIRTELLNATDGLLKLGAHLGWISEEERADWGREFATDINVGRIGMLPPAERLEALTNGMIETEGAQPVFQRTGTVIDHMPVDKRIDMIRTAQQEIVAERREDRLEAERQVKAEQEARKALQAVVADDFVTRLWDKSGESESLTYRDILASDLEQGTKRTFLKLLDDEANNRGKPRTAWGVHTDFFTKIADGSIALNDMVDKVLPFVGSGLTPADYGSLRTFAKALEPDGGKRSKALVDFLKMAKKLISASTIMGNDPAGEWQNFKFESRFMKLYTQERENGVSEEALLDPNSPSFLGPLINHFTRTNLEAMRDWSDRARGGQFIPPVITLP